MSSDWHYTSGGSEHGPVAEAELKSLAGSGHLQPGDLVWREGMQEWVPASKLKGLFPTAAKPPGPPPIPTKSRPSPPPIAEPAASSAEQPPSLLSRFDRRKALLYGYRAALVIAVLSTLLPWMTVNSAFDYDSNRVPGMSGFRGFQVDPVRTAGNTSIGIHGTSTGWGVTVLLVGIGGVVLSFLGPTQFLKDKTRLGMAGVGGAIVLLVVIAMMTYSSPVSTESNYRDAFGNSASASLSYAVGLYLTILAGIGAAVTGYLHPWDADPPR